MHTVFSDYRQACCIWPVYTWGIEWAHTSLQTKDGEGKKRNQGQFAGGGKRPAFTTSLLKREWAGLPYNIIPPFKSLECEIQQLPLFHFNRVFMFKKKRFGLLSLCKQVRTNKGYLCSALYPGCQPLLSLVSLANAKVGGEVGKLHSEPKGRPQASSDWRLLARGAGLGLTRSGWLVWGHIWLSLVGPMLEA